MFTPSDKPALLLQWLKRARESQHSHHDTARLLRRLDRVLGLLVVLLTAFLMFGLVAAIEMNADQMPVIRIAFIAISAIATFIGIAQSAMSPSDRARARSL